MQCLDDETAALVLTRGLSEEALADVEKHVDGCEDCFHLLASLAETMTPPLDAPDPEERSAAREPGASTRVPLYKRGARIGRYVLVEKVGAGGMGSVFAAEDPALARTIAIKLVRTTLRSDRANENLLAEARMMAQLSHPNVVPVYDVGAEDEHVFLAMELIDGSNVRQWLAQEKRSVDEIVRVFREAGRGLVAAHRAGLVHRDFKPDNVLVGKDGRVVVTDFGLAHSTLAPSDRVAGTMAYMAPEQRDGNVADARSDQFSFAVALYEALSGERPKTGAETAAPAWLGRIVSRGMATDPQARFPSMEAMLDALARDPKRTWRRRVVGTLVLGAAAALAIGGASWNSRHTHACADAVPAKLAGTWDSARRAEVDHAFAAVGADAHAVDATLDAYARDWTAMHVDACDAAFVRKEQSAQLFDLRVACLGERLAELRAATSLFATADTRIAANAANAARALTPVASCGDARALLAIKPPPPEAAARVAELRRELARAKAMRDGGKLADAIGVARAVARDAEPTGYAPLLASALLQLGDAELANGEGEEADATLGRAALAADASRDDVTRARALTRQLYAAGFALERFDRVPALDAQVESILARLGGDDELEGDRLQTMGMIALAQRDLGAAAERLTRAIALREKRFGPHGRRVAMSRYGRCVVRLEAKQLDAALEDCDAALDIWRTSLGASHPDTSLALKYIGAIELAKGHVDEGCHDVEQALAIEETALGAEHPTIAGTLLHLADCRAARGDRAGALAAARRALAIREAKLGATHRKTEEARAAVRSRELDAGSER